MTGRITSSLVRGLILSLILGVILGLIQSCGDDEEETEAGQVQDTSSSLDAGPSKDLNSTEPGTDSSEPSPSDPGEATDSNEPDSGDGNVPVSPDEAAVLALSVTSGPTAGGTTTVIICVNFAADFRDVGPTVKFGGSPATEVKALSRGILEVLSPPGVAGTQIVSVSAAGESASLQKGFTYTDEVPESYVKLSLAGGIEPGGVQLQLPLQLEIVGGAQLAALLIDIKQDPLQLPLAAPTPVDGQVAEKANKTLDYKMKTDGLRLLLIGKNRDSIGSGTITQLFYIVPPATPYQVTPLTVSAQAVDAFGAPIPVITTSGWVAVEADDE